MGGDPPITISSPEPIRIVITALFVSEDALWMLRVRRPVKPSRFSILVILFLPRNKDRRLAEMGKFSIVCRPGRKGSIRMGLLRQLRRAQFPRLL